MPQKTAAEHITEMKVQQPQFNKELAEVQEEVACEEKQHAEEVAVKKKKERKEHERCNVECKQEEELTVAKYEAEAKAWAKAGESLRGSDASLDTEVRIMGVTTKVSDSVVITNLSELGK